LDLLGFIRQNRDFSMGYSEKNKKIPVSFRFIAERLAGREFDPARGTSYSTEF
jgi:hypothetical protein